MTASATAAATTMRVEVGVGLVRPFRIADASVPDIEGNINIRPFLEIRRTPARIGATHAGTGTRGAIE
ncbi:hypothetical protein AB0K67_11050 [Nonomuraea sp. NPDC052634]|uniref:hypothetical protein n=1 Tax=Nonomuraea sp. NPDC052634 TaxID=3155813 RepID=UPI0034468CAC